MIFFKGKTDAATIRVSLDLGLRVDDLLRSLQLTQHLPPPIISSLKLVLFSPPSLPVNTASKNLKPKTQQPLHSLSHIECKVVCWVV